MMTPPARTRAARRARPLRLRPRVTAAPGREQVAAILARRRTRERLVLTLLWYERLAPAEVADALGISRRQVERTRAALLAELRRVFARPAARVRESAPRLRRAA